MGKTFCNMDEKETDCTERHISANNVEANKPFKYCSNYIKTCKYNIFTFLPINLFEQFRKAANLYFLLQIIIMSIPQITALNPLSTAIPLSIVLIVSMIKDAYDDYGRYKSDLQVNNKSTFVLRSEDGRLKKKKWQHVMTGDILKISSDEPVAADVLLISTENPSGLCFIETADLDGETNLKVRQPLPETAIIDDNIHLLTEFDGKVVCEFPNNRLERFHGNLHWNDTTYSIDNNNIILRGCVLRNTLWVYGLVIYAGHDSKIMMNSGKSSFKRTKLDLMTNKLVMLIALALAVVCTFCSIMSYVWERNTGRDFQVILPWEKFYKNSPLLIAVINWPGFVMVLNTLIPISLYISVELVRLGQSWLIDWDIHLYDKETDTPASARNTTLTEELGQIEYVFSDKTGTLTQNVMVFKECSINGEIYGHSCEGIKDSLNDDQVDMDKDFIDFSGNKYADPAFQFTDHALKRHVDSNDKHCEEFFKVLALCHTVMVDEKMLDETDFVPCATPPNATLEYQAQSPDEGALVSAARNFGFVFKSRTPSSITIEKNNVEETFELLCILDFDNVRKRMSVIVRKNGKISLYCKGADTVLYELLSKESEAITSSTQKHLDNFACSGLRTLVLASKDLSQDEFARWWETYKEASTAMDDREEKMFRAFELIERDLNLVGATAIEDKLQDGVPDAIANLAEANIKIWVLTGDKQETAINIGYSSMLLTDNMVDVFIIDATDATSICHQMNEFLEKLEQYEDSSSINGVKVKSPGENGLLKLEKLELDEARPKEGFALVISGKSLAFALQKKNELLFLKLAKSCKAVICSRVTPLQKALVVELVKKNVKATTLAIGDGANDVSMIKAAHIGIGISGKEGRQAVLAADYSFAQFRFLERLLLVHGRWSYWRTAKFLNYFFYKNYAFTLVQLWYNFFCGFTAQTLYDTWFLSVYNVCFTSLPVLAVGIFDQDVNDVMSLENPRLYIPGQGNTLFNKKTLAIKLMHGALTSLVLFFLPCGIYYDRVSSTGQPQSHYIALSVAIGAILVLVVNLQMALDTCHWTWINHFFVWGSIVFYFIYTFIIYSVSLFQAFPTIFPTVGAATDTFGSGTFWATLIVTSVVCIFPVLGYRWCVQKLRPTLADYIRRGLWKQKQSRATFLFNRRLQRSASARPSTARSGYAFSQQSGFGEMIMGGKWLPRLKTKSKQSYTVTNS